MGKIGTALLVVSITFLLITYLYSIRYNNHATKAKQFSSDARDLADLVDKVLTDDISCKANLKPSRLNNGDMTNLVQGLNDSTVEDMTLLTVNEDFKSLNIVKISLIGSGDSKTQVVSRDFTVYFKGKELKTKGNNPCDSSDTSGCYKSICILDYQIENNENPDVIVCDVQQTCGVF